MEYSFTMATQPVGQICSFPDFTSSGIVMGAKDTFMVKKNSSPAGEIEGRDQKTKSKASKLMRIHIVTGTTSLYLPPAPPCNLKVNLFQLVNKFIFTAWCIYCSYLIFPV